MGRLCHGPSRQQGAPRPHLGPGPWARVAGSRLPTLGQVRVTTPPPPPRAHTRRLVANTEIPGAGPHLVPSRGGAHPVEKGGLTVQAQAGRAGVDHFQSPSCDETLPWGGTVPASGCDFSEIPRPRSPILKSCPAVFVVTEREIRLQGGPPEPEQLHS